jgi:hypothetical protein
MGVSNANYSSKLLMDKDIPEVQAEAKVYKNNALIFFT